MKRRPVNPLAIGMFLRRVEAKYWAVHSLGLAGPLARRAVEWVAAEHPNLHNAAVRAAREAARGRA